jgi:acyl-CoA synthetase (AMP-forming)/AMP-acid ligase II
MLTVRHTSQYLFRAAAEYPERVAIECEQGVISYALLAERARRIAAGLRSLQLPHKAGIGLALRDPLSWSEALFGAWEAGYGVVPMPWERSAAVLARYAMQNNVRVLLVSEGFLTAIAPTIATFAAPPIVFVVGVPSPTLRGHRTYGELKSIGGPCVVDDVPTHARALTLFDNSQTGHARGLAFTHAQLIAQLDNFDSVLPPYGDNVASKLLCLDPCPSFVTLAALLCSVRHASTLDARGGRFDVESALSRLRAGGVSSVWGWFPFHQRIASRVAADNIALPELTHLVSLGSTGFELLDHLEDAFRAPVYAAYGPPEAMHCACWNLPGARKAGSLGRIGPQLEACLSVDEDLASLRVEALGYLCVKGATVCQTFTTSTGEEVALDAQGWLASSTICYRDAAPLQASQRDRGGSRQFQHWHVSHADPTARTAQQASTAAEAPRRICDHG